MPPPTPASHRTLVRVLAQMAGNIIAPDATALAGTSQGRPYNRNITREVLTATQQDAATAAHKEAACADQAQATATETTQAQEGSISP